MPMPGEWSWLIAIGPDGSLRPPAAIQSAVSRRARVISSSAFENSNGETSSGQRCGVMCTLALDPISCRSRSIWLEISSVSACSPRAIAARGGVCIEQA